MFTIDSDEEEEELELEETASQLNGDGMDTTTGNQQVSPLLPLERAAQLESSLITLSGLCVCVCVCENHQFSASSWIKS